MNDHAIPSTGSNGIKKLAAKMGDLPEWKVRGQHLSGTALNWCIGIIASCGFLMFGYAFVLLLRR